MTLAVAAPTAEARAQTFTYRHPSGAVSAPFSFTTLRTTVNGVTDHEFIDDFAGNSSPPAGFAGSYRITANLNQRYRVIANPWMRTPSIVFSRFDMSNVNTNGPDSFDRLNFDWFYAGSPNPWTGQIGPFTMPAPGFAGTNSMTFPGLVLRVRTGPEDLRTTPIAPEHESWGFSTSSLQVGYSSTMGSATLPTFQPHDSIVGLVNGVDDVVRGLLLAAPTGIVLTVAAWNDPGDTSWGMAVWARCGADPAPGVFDAGAPLNSNAGALLELGDCASQWHIAFTNVSASARVFRATIGARDALVPGRDLAGITVGIGGWTPTPTQMDVIRRRFREAAWRLYGMTGGGQVLRSFRFIVNPWLPWCSPFLCDGNQCNYCLIPADGISTCDALGQGHVTLFAGSDGASPEAFTIAHEAAHCFMSLPDEYARVGGITYERCHHGQMSTTVNAFCTPATHRTSTVDYVQGGSIRGVFSYYPGGSVYYPSTTSFWELMYNTAVVPYPYPPGQTPDSYPYSFTFLSNASIGRFD